jgi:hypothetical protein
MALICVPSSRSSDAVPGSGIRYLEAFVEGNRFKATTATIALPYSWAVTTAPR